MSFMLCMNFFSLSASAATGGFQVSGTKLYDANGNEFIMRGVTTHMHGTHRSTQQQFLQLQVKALTV